MEIDAAMHACRRVVAGFVGLVIVTGIASPVQAQVPSDPYNYSRTSAFTYYGTADGAKNGLLKSETVEPDNAQSCVTTSYGYDPYGNKNSATTANCAGASGRAVFTSRGSSGTYAALPAQAIRVNGASVTVAVAAGIYATASSNALGQGESRTYDPRFGAVLSLTGPNGLTTSWLLDDFGRKVKELRADGTSTVYAYCVLASSLDQSANSSATNGDPLNCPTPAAGEKPADAVMLVHSEARDANGTKMGPFTRVYTDRLGRELRSVTESFDGAAQPADRRAALVVRDSVYDVNGAKVLETQPYFLVSASSTTGGANDVGVVKTNYDVLGRPTGVYTADPQGSQAGVSFGAYGTRQASRQTIVYNGLSITTTNDKGQARTEEKNANGELVRVTDATGAQLVHQRDAFGNLIATKDALQNTITVAYDIRGRKTQMTDPDTGLWKYEYDALGQLVWQQSAKQRAAGTQTTLTYDVLGRMTSRVEPEYTSNWSYDKNADGSYCMQGSATTRGAGKLCESKTSNGVGRKLVYDSLGRPINARTTITNGPSFASAVGYDVTTGRIASQTYPSGLKVSPAYTARGFFEKLTLVTPATVTPLPNAQGQTAAGTTLPANSVLWQAQIVNAWGRTERESYGNNVVADAVFESATGRTTDLRAGTGGTHTVLDHTYTWDSLGNLIARIDRNGDGGSGAVSEVFTYGDGLNRLTRYQVSAPAIPNLSRTVSLQYNALGMLLYKSDVGNYSYGEQGPTSVRPHALRSVTGSSNTSYGYDANGNLISATGGKYRSVSYTTFNLPDSQSGIQGPGGSPKYTWQYDESHARIRETRVDASGTRTTWYMHPDNAGGLGFESETAPSGSISNRHYLSAGGTSIGVLVSTGALPSLTSTQTAPPSDVASIVLVKLEYWHKDHLGSLAATTDHTGAVTQRYAYDPFGKRRYTNGSYDAFGNLVIDWSSTVNYGTDRGYTGHEQLDDIGLIHMNGRIFDPTLGLFLQADPLVQDMTDLQNFNRYGYCLNNPMTCTDPSGLSFLGSAVGFNNKWGFFVPARIMDPFGYAVTQRIAHTQVGYQLGSIAIATVSAIYCNAYAPLCNAVGQAAWAGFAGYSNDQAARIGLVSGATAAAFQAVGTWTGAGTPQYSPGWNTVGHMGVGCASARANGASCASGALSAGFAAAYTNYGPAYSGHVVIATMQHAMVGGVGSILGGGKFGNGAVTGAFGYLFNECAHTRMCGSDSTRVTVSGNRIALDFAHAEIQISSGYDFVVLEGQPGYSNGNGLLEGRSNGANMGDAFAFDLVPTDGRTMAQFANDLMAVAAGYRDNLVYGFPSPRFRFNNLNGGYNSNSYVAGVLDAAAPGSGFTYGVQGAAARQGFRVPGIENPIPLRPVRK